MYYGDPQQSIKVY